VKIKAKLKCPGCDIRSEAAFRRPGILGDRTIVDLICDGCGSQVRHAVYRKSTKTSEIQTSAVIVIESPLLNKMRVEEAEHRAKPVEDQ